ncbi:MAG: hypothetical protein HJJLKODD_01058 [Phycisphaerae bacterium]|nr:hypothetical protein [Phycisphaerae bacterium]
MLKTLLRKMMPNRHNGRSYWSARYTKAAGHDKAVGDRRMSEEQIRGAYAQKLEILQQAWRQHWPGGATGRLLDAGCGFGYYTEGARQTGFDVLGVDFIDTAVAEARLRYPQCTFEVGDLTRLNLGRTFEAIISLNTYVAIVDEVDWRSAVQRVAAHLAPGGLWCLMDMLAEQLTSPDHAAHIAYRSVAQYAEILQPLGLRIKEHRLIPIHEFGYDETLLMITR